ncbi:hypothetical protein OC861_006119 [Tilletia horrida]|nr:hypothetical protein OC861_006119 [Tilletia horrida]
MKFSIASLFLLASAIAVQGAPVSHLGVPTKEVKASKLIHEKVHPIIILPFERTGVNDFVAPDRSIEQEIKELMVKSPKMLQRASPVSPSEGAPTKRDDEILTSSVSAETNGERSLGGETAAAEARSIHRRGLFGSLIKWASRVYDSWNVGNWLTKNFGHIL